MTWSLVTRLIYHTDGDANGHRAVRALPTRRATRSIRELLVKHRKGSDTLTSIFLLANTAVLASSDLFVGILEVATERRPAVEAAVAVLARADVGRDTCVYINVSWGASI